MSRPSQAAWRVLDSGPGDWAFNMALDEALLEAAVTLGAPVLRFYGWQQPAASFGYFQRIAEIEALTPLRPLVRRPTGGGLVPHDRDWTYSLIVPPRHEWYELRAPESYRRAHQWVQTSLARLGVETTLAPCCRKELPGQCFAGHEESDVLWCGRKVAGAAQRRNRCGLLIQGSIQPPPPGVTRAEWQAGMAQSAPQAGAPELVPLALSAILLERAGALAAGRYAQDAHNRKR